MLAGIKFRHTSLKLGAGRLSLLMLLLTTTLSAILATILATILLASFSAIISVILSVILSANPLWAESGLRAGKEGQPLYEDPSGSQDPAEDILIKGLDFARLAVQVEVQYLPDAKVRADYVAKLQEVLARNLCWSGVFSVIAGRKKYCGVKQGTRADLLLELKLKKKQLELNVFDLGPAGKLLFEHDSPLKKILKEANMMEVVNQMAESVTGVRGTLGTSIAFTIKEEGANQQIAITDTHQAEPQVISSSKEIVILPRLAPDSSAMVYTEISRRGSRIYYHKLGKRGKRSRYLTDFGSLNSGGSFSSDGRLSSVISVGGGTDLFLFNINKRRAKPQIITRRRGIEIQPDWSPDNTQLLYVSNRSGSPQIYLLSLKNGRDLRLTYHNSYSADPRWSPDGKKIMFTRRLRGVDQVHIMNNLGQDVFALTGGRYNCEQSEWSPDGRQVVFSSRRSGEFKLYVAAIDGSGLRRVTKTGKGVSENSPSWGRVRLN